LNPGFFETLEFIIDLPPLGDDNFPQPGLSLLIYDEDEGLLGAKKDLLGRVWIQLETKKGKIKSPVDQRLYEVYSHVEHEWWDLIFDATPGTKEGKVLVGYDIIQMDLKDKFPVEKINIKPLVSPGTISIAVIGMRDVLSSLNLFPIKKMFLKFDISGDSKDAIITNKHPVKGGACNFLEIISVDLDVPHELDYAPVLTVYAYDNLMGFLGTRLLGITNIPLLSYCEEIMMKKNFVSNAFRSNEEVGVSAIQLKVDAMKIKKNAGLDTKRLEEEIKENEGPLVVDEKD